MAKLSVSMMEADESSAICTFDLLWWDGGKFHLTLKFMPVTTTNNGISA